MIPLDQVVDPSGFLADGDWVESKDQDPKGNIRLTQLADVGDGEFRDRSNRWLNSSQADRLRVTYLRQGDVLVARMPDPLGRACVCPNLTTPAVTVVDVCIVRAPAHNPAWLCFAINAPQTRSSIARFTSGSTRKRISKKNLGLIEIPAPARVEQDRVVAAIEPIFSRLHAAVASLARAKANVKRARASVLKAAVEGRLVPTEAALARGESRTYEHAAVMLARIERPARPSRFNSRSSDVIVGHAALSVGDPRVTLPEGWVRAALVDAARMESGHTPSRNHPEWWDGDVPWLGIADARVNHGGTIHKTIQHTNLDGLANSAARLLPAGTVCLSRTASVGYVLIAGVPLATSQDFANWVCTEALLPRWVQIVFMADRDSLARFAKGSVHKTIYFPELLSLHLSVPPLAEQHRIIAELDRRLSVLDALDASIDANLARCASLRQAILKRAFEGRLVTPQPDVNIPVSKESLADHGNTSKPAGTPTRSHVAG